jgi:hypothetical protein
MMKFVVFANTFDLAIYASEWIRVGSKRIGIPSDAINILNFSGPPTNLLKPVSNPGDTVEVIDVHSLSILGHLYCTNTWVIQRIKYAVFDNNVGHTNVVKALEDNGNPRHSVRYFKKYLTRLILWMYRDKRFLTSEPINDDPVPFVGSELL